ncbi:MAG: hypothetical protein OQK77_07655, partial [Psychromonas sp.]|nr:hypothetical protein [Psychromonas sp.]
NIGQSFEDLTNNLLDEDKGLSNGAQLKLDNVHIVENWTDWIQNQLDEFLISKLSIKLPGKGFQSIEDQKQYILWQLMELIGYSSCDFDSDTIYCAKGELSGSKGIYIFIPTKESRFLILSLLND